MHIGAGFTTPKGFENPQLGIWTRGARVLKPLMDDVDAGATVNVTDPLPPWRFNGKTHKVP